MALAMTDAIPLMQADGTTGRNNARDIRTQLLGALFTPDSSGSSVRPGVLPRNYVNTTGAEFVDLKVIQLSTPGQGVQLYPGKCIAVRTGQGPYLLTQETTVSLYNLDAADPSNARIDIIYARLYDQAIGDVTLQGPYLEHVNGTPSGSPVAPTGSVPAGAVMLAQILRPAATNNVTGANITDLRKSTQLQAVPRPLMPGDSLSDAGLFPSERRLRLATTTQIAAGSPPYIEEIWCADSKWRPTTYDIVGRNRRSTNITTTQTAAATAQRVMTARASVLAGRTYRISGRTSLSHSSATAAAQVNFIYTTNDVEPVASGTVMFREILTFGGVGVPETLQWTCLYEAATDHVLRVTPCMFTAIGAGTLTWECATGPNPSDLVIEDRGPTLAISGTIY
jgi:hypothetical protein